MQQKQLKLGETLEVHASLTQNGVAVDITSWVIKSQVRNPADGTLIADLTVTLKDQSTDRGGYTITGDTTTWPLGTFYWDIAYNHAGSVSYTDTISLTILPSVTRL